MAHINLLPWRENRRAEHKKNYLTLLALLALGAFGLMFAAANVLEKMTDNQNVRNNFIEQQTERLRRRYHWPKTKICLIQISSYPN